MVESLLPVVWLIPLFPALGAVLNGLFGRLIRTKAHWVAIPAVFLSFLFSLVVFASLLKDHSPHQVTLYRWIASDGFFVSVGFLFDTLSATMLLVVTGVGLLVHIYSVGYMHQDTGYARYFSYLNLFIFFMLMLVLADNYLLMFLGWEGVGLCSYLLIGFWFHKKSASDAAKKAFIVNRIGDAGFILGILLIIFMVGTTSYAVVLDALPHHVHRHPAESGILTAITLLLFIGAVGKSAQIPLYVWLPDAMEGPTPVSALIHAATMVTAGIYMVCRSHALYLAAPFAMQTIAVTGAATALFAGTIATVQNDMKKVLAYSTVSQLGFMFLALGVGAFVAGMFHLVTHAFFKGLLFLGAGSVIHAASNEQDMQKLGGLRKKLPVTFATMLLGGLAIAGVPPFAGFWSKDEILTQTLQKGHPFLFGVAAMAAVLTAFYIFRLLYLTFFGKTRLSKEAAHHLHESPLTMIFALLVLAFLSVTGGFFLGFPPENGALHHFLSASIHMPRIEHHFTSFNLMLMAGSVAMAGTGWFLAHLFYRLRPELPARLAKKRYVLYWLLFNRYWIDELYDKTVLALSRGLSKLSFACDRYLIDGMVNGAGQLAVGLSGIKRFIDERIIDGTANGLAAATQSLSGSFRKIQTGGVQNYILTMTGGAVFLVGILVFLFK